MGDCFSNQTRLFIGRGHSNSGRVENESGTVTKPSDGNEGSNRNEGNNENEATAATEAVAGSRTDHYMN